jgi:hypothetical protein
MGFEIPQYWEKGKSQLGDKVLNGLYHYKNPLFHRSTIPLFHD